MKSSRLLSLLLAACLLFSLSSCSERGGSGQQDPIPAETESSAADNAAPQEDTATDAPADQQSAGEAESAGQQQPPQRTPRTRPITHWRGMRCSTLARRMQTT